MLTGLVDANLVCPVRIARRAGAEPRYTRRAATTPTTRPGGDQVANQRTGKVQTVLGLIEPEQMGITTMHEHLVIDFRARYKEPSEVSRVRMAHTPVSMPILYDLRGAPFDNLDNLQLLDEPTQISEAMEFKLSGGGTVVDTTTIGL